MKTKGLVLKNGLLTLLLILSLSLNCFSSVNVNGTVASSSEIKRHKTKDLTSSLTASKENVFTETLKGWMEGGLYWKSAGGMEGENTEISDNILLQDKTPVSSDLIDKLTESLKNWMQNGFYWDKIDKQ